MMAKVRRLRIASSKRSSVVTKVLNVEKTSLAPAIAARIAQADRPAWVTPDRWRRVSALYKSYDDSPLWLEEGGVKERATALLDAIRHAPEDGLDTRAYPVEAVERVVDTSRITDTASARYKRLAAAGGWPTVTAGMSDAEARAAVHARHVTEMTDSTTDRSDSAAAADTTPLPSAPKSRHARSPLAAEILRFQEHHG